jgi:hypothetical protein
MKFSERVAGKAPRSSGVEEATDSLRTITWNRLHTKLFELRAGSAINLTDHAKARVWQLLPSSVAN